MSNPDSWLRATDLAQTTHVTVTEDDVEHATQERSVATDALLPPIRNRPGIKRALNAALARFPAFARIKSTRTTASTNSEDTAVANAHDREREREQRSRSKSNSSAGHSVGDAGGPGTGSSTLVSDSPVSGGVSRQPSDGGAALERRGKSREGGGGFGVDLRRIISGGGRDGDSSGTASPSMSTGHRGGWGSRSLAFRKTPSMEPHPPPGLPELSRSISSSSVLGTSPGGGSGSRSHFSHHFFTRKASDSDTVAARSSQSSSVVPSPSPGGGRSSGFSPSPWAGSDTESSAQAAKGGRSLSRMLSRLHSHSGGPSGTGSSAATSANASVRSSRSGARQPSGSTDGGSDDHHHHAPHVHSRVVSAQSLSPGVAPQVLEQYEAAGATRDQYDALGRLVVHRNKDRSHSGASALSRASFRAGIDAAKAELDEDEGQIDLTEFEYSDSDDDLDDDDDDDDLDDFMQPPLAQGNQMSGWNYPGFADFQIGGPRDPATGEPSAQAAPTSSAYLSPTHTPPTDDVGLGEDDAQEEDGKVGPSSTPSAAAASLPTKPPTPPYVPYADSVSFQLCPLDLDFESLGLYNTARRSSEDQTPRTAAPAGNVVDTAAASALSAGLQIPMPPPPTLAEAYASSTRSRSPRDGSIRGVSLDPPSPRKASAALDVWGDEDEDGDEEEILVVPRRRRAATLQGLGGAPPTSPR